MAKWKNIRSATGGTLKGGITYDGHKGESSWEIYQDEQPFIDRAKQERDAGNKSTHMNHKKFATIPDIVAIEVSEKFGIDIHDPLIMHDKGKLARFKQIIMQHYPYLVVNKA